MEAQGTRSVTKEATPQDYDPRKLASLAAELETSDMEDDDGPA